MQLAARSYLASGVAALGAGAIAISPVAPPLPDVPVPAISSAGVNLAAAVDPIEAYTQLIVNTFDNVQATIATEVSDPVPILQQVIANQLGSAQSLAAGLQEAAEGVAPLLDPSNPNGIPAQLQSAVTQLIDGNVNGAVATAWSALLSPVLYGAFPLITPLTDAVKQPVQNLLNVLNNPLVVLAPALGALNVAYTTITVTGNVGQDFVDAVKAGDPTDVVNTVLSGPARITDAFLNGTTQGGGVLGQNLGLLSSLRQARDLIAAAITPPAAASTSVADTATKTLTVDVTPKEVTAKEVTAPAPADAATATAATESDADAVADTVADTKAATSTESSPVTTVKDSTKDSTKAEPGKTATAAKPDRVKRLNKARNDVRNSVKNVTDGLKKAVDGLRGKSKTTTKPNTTKAGSDSGSSEKSSSAA